ncbi:GrpB protein [Acididesulfobacillus acetoxydans]|uniref:GrpB protein n=1 Tax=Acididesulfobacillus acetoxydans TaxID=1561005 RepID=A0A8S0Y3R3_9FIRM|nr:GrpB family protein [Acididesulfobacillus acetoxydans]CAA7602325.1 GrpB protein [Acididesulfobacillus acetoxydans]CEJ08440.1 UPF0157 protein YqkA [Acididesulfobacillus acetoxydans]
MKVVVVEYDPRWPRMFEAEANLIRGVLGEELIALYHIGSTSVPGIMAKPIIDMMPVVRDIEAVDRFNDKMIELGYEPMGEFGISRRRFFRKGGDARTHHVHIFQEGSEDIVRHLAFRDFLRAHEDAAREYGALKRLLAERFPDDIESYMDGKDSFIKELEARALALYKTM